MDNLSALRRQFTGSFQVLSIDLLDHGKSSFTDTFSFKQNAEAIIELLARLKIKRISVVGHSLGGKVAMQLALEHNELITHLVVLDIAPVEYQARHQTVFKGLNNVILATIQSRSDADVALAEYVVDKSTRQFLLKSLYSEDGKWAWRFNLAMLENDYTKLSAAITSNSPFSGPVLFLKGELSDYLLAEHKQPVIELFPNSRSRVISAAGHWLHAEKPELCAKAILAFLNN